MNLVNIFANNNIIVNNIYLNDKYKKRSLKNTGPNTLQVNNLYPIYLY